MKIPLSWLKEFVEITMPVEQLAQRLTLSGMEVVNIEYIGVEGGELPWDPALILVCNILEVSPHPNADRLVLAEVDYGGPQPHTVVTGAPNLFPYRGQGRLSHPLKSVFAREGARLYDGHAEGKVITTLKGRPVRGVMSDAMLCSAKELGISDDHEGILFLEDDAPVGTPLRDMLGEVVLELEFTPNYARCLSLVGMAREVAGLTGGQLHLPDPQVVMEGPPLAGRAGVTITDPALCPRFAIGLIEGVQIGESPRWMQRRLSHAGMRPINVVVDISNYVMLEWGQPTHAFDADRVQDQQLIVRNALPGERLLTLDGKDRSLSPSTDGELRHAPLMVCDATGPLSIAGVMGGEASEVRTDSSRILFEAAIWEPTQIRKTARAFKLPSEASRRFERGVDYALPPIALRRGLSLMQQYAGGTVAEGFVDAYPRPWQPVVLDLPPSEVARIVGVRLGAHDIASALRQLGFGCEVLGGGGAGDFAALAIEPVVRVTVPSFRLDVSILADLCEEVARVYGYDKIPETRLADELPPPDFHPDVELEQRVRDIMTGSGLNEVITPSLISMELVAKVDPDEAVAERYLKLSNPSTPERVYMRRSLLPSVLEALATNLRERERTTIFELGRVYLRREDAATSGNWLPAEPRRLAVVMAGPRQPLGWSTASAEQLDFYDIKGVVETLSARLGLSGRVSFAPLTEDERFHRGRSAEILLAPQEGGNGAAGRLSTGAVSVGVVGELHPAVRERLELSVGRALAAEIDLEALIAVAQAAKYRTISRYPATIQDLAVVAPLTTPAEQIAATITRQAGELLESLTLFDVYSGPQVGEGKRSLAYRMVFRAVDRTLNDEALVKLRAKIVKALERELGATIRA
jgi:phenylalanyl-tRNA synthetase beta chain